MAKRGTAIVLFFGLFISTSAASLADGKEAISRSEILRQHHRLLHQMLMVLKDNVNATEKILGGKMSNAERRKMKGKMADVVAEVDEMVQRHDRLMKLFEEIIQNQEVRQDKEPEEATP